MTDSAVYFLPELLMQKPSPLLHVYDKRKQIGVHDFLIGLCRRTVSWRSHLGL